jgi:uncharacterized protein YjbI with pentapeptide repeats
MRRLTEAEVLRRYHAGDRDFRGADLSGLRFRRATLAGADFSGANLRGTDFLKADLREARFNGSHCGLQLITRLWQGICEFVLGMLGGLLMCMAYAIIGTQVLAEANSILSKFGWGLGIPLSFSFVIFLIGFIWEGFSSKGIGCLVIANILSVTTALTGSRVQTTHEVLGYALSIAATGAVAVSLPTAISAASFAGASVSSLLIASRFGDIGDLLEKTVLILVLVSLFISFWRVQKGGAGYAGIRSFARSLRSNGATRFCSSDLRGAFFNDARLTWVNFAASPRDAPLLEHVCWKGARGLELARLGGTSLGDPRCLQLLLSGFAPGGDLRGLNLRGAYLPQADLREARLCEANLSEAVLTDAHLEGANLKACQCLGTDLAGAHLTGATLEGWNIDHDTKLKGVDCAYVYLLEPLDALGQRRDDHHRERLPHDPDKSFGPGDFEAYFQLMIEEVKLLIKNGVDAKAFQQAFQEVMRQHPQISQEAIGIKLSGNDVLVTLQAPASVDKGEVEQTFFAKYNAVMLENARLKGLLAGERRVAELERERATQFAELVSRLVTVTQSNPYPTTVVNTTIHAGDGNLINTGTLNTAGGMVNLGDLSDQAQMTIEALPDQRSAEGQPSLRELLQELKTSVDADTQLLDDTRAKALAEVTELAKAAQEPQKNVGPAHSAIDALKGLSAGLTETNKAMEESSKLLAAVRRLLPLISGFFLG